MLQINQKFLHNFNPRRIGTSFLFGFSCFRRHSGQKKPHPMPIKHSCDVLALKPKEAIMVGDSCNDIEAGFSAGTYVVTVPYGYQYGQSIKSDKVDLAIKNLNDLVPIIN